MESSGQHLHMVKDEYVEKSSGEVELSVTRRTFALWRGGGVWGNGMNNLTDAEGMWCAWRVGRSKETKGTGKGAGLCHCSRHILFLRFYHQSQRAFVCVQSLKVFC